MPAISSYALQYSNVSYSGIAASTFDLFITEGAPLPRSGSVPAITDGQVAALIGQGRTVVGYVNAGVTDANRGYWNTAWTHNGDDLGTPTGSAPAWLQGQPANAFGRLVKFWDPAWQQIVIDQAVALVSRGYSGVFIDDIGTYYALGAPGGTAQIREYATLMCEFVAAIEQAITAVRPDAYVVVNTDPYLVTNVTLDARGTAAAAAFRAAVDAHLLENQSAAAIDYAQTSLSGETLLILESDGAPAYGYADSWQRGILYTAPLAYNGAGTFAYPATEGADTLSGGDGPNQISGLGGHDWIDGSGGADTLDGGLGNDTLFGGAGADTMSGGAGDDTFHVDSAGDLVLEASAGGSDRIYASGDYTLFAGQHVETLSTDWHAGTAAINLGGNELDNIIYGNAGNNILYGKGGNDFIGGLGGDDSYFIDSAGDYVQEAAGGGNDRIYAGGDYTLYTGQYVEILSTDNNAGTAAIALGGNELDNIIYGNNGNNILYGKGGNDTLLGLGGNDQFWFNTTPGAGNVDTIYGFVSGADKLVLFQSVFGALSTGGLPASAFVIGTTAGDMDDRIIYNSTTGALLYDADGNAAGAAVQFATLNGAPVINAGDFSVI